MRSSVGPQAQQHSCQVRLHAEDFGLRLGSDRCHGPSDDTVCGYTLLQGTGGYPGHGLPSQWLVLIDVLYPSNYSVNTIHRGLKIHHCIRCMVAHNGDFFCFGKKLLTH